MEDILILAVGRQHIELAAKHEQLIQLVKQLQSENDELKKKLDGKPTE